MADQTIRATVTVDVDELREWAGRHAVAGHHGVAHVLYQAAAGVESITEQHDREVAERAWDEAHECDFVRDEDCRAYHRNPYREGGAS